MAKKSTKIALLFWPMAALYAAFYLGEQEAVSHLGDWLVYTIMASVALVPALFLGYLIGREHGDSHTTKEDP
jgi:hypothetical protein